MSKTDVYFNADDVGKKVYRKRTYYLSLVIEAYCRKIMVYHLSKIMNHKNVVRALQMTKLNCTNHTEPLLIIRLDKFINVLRSTSKKRLQT